MKAKIIIKAPNNIDIIVPSKDGEDVHFQMDWHLLSGLEKGIGVIRHLQEKTKLSDLELVIN